MGQEARTSGARTPQQRVHKTQRGSPEAKRPRKDTVPWRYSSSDDDSGDDASHTAPGVAPEAVDLWSRAGKVSASSFVFSSFPLHWFGSHFRSATEDDVDSEEENDDVPTKTKENRAVPCYVYGIYGKTGVEYVCSTEKITMDTLRFTALDMQETSGARTYIVLKSPDTVDAWQLILPFPLNYTSLGPPKLTLEAAQVQILEALYSKPE
eukprot:NODE_1019_length_696_cov_1035.421947_g794_i0.p1 GENE.NODE_1019_length_696_cov_1035.421947_g794_i0~~NODE_1019_length_696_cov_1035.421947_g794_i0.p1  ORF type:complete len:217 (+),score=50.83 NODE_1019_length_696_cov_1035.421947_g794_i0:27-653(+)